MRPLVRLLGLDLLDVELVTSAPYEAAEDDCEPDYSRDLSGGTTGAYPLGFTSHMEAPYEYDMPDRDL